MYKLYSTAAVADSSSRGKRKLLVILVGLCCVGTPVYTAELRYQYCAVNVSAVEADKRMAANYRYPSVASPRSPQGLETDVCPGAPNAPYSATGRDCFWRGVDCSPGCLDGSGQWMTADFFYANVWTSQNPQVDFWPPNTKVEIHSGFQGVRRLARWKAWWWDGGPYEFLGWFEEPVYLRGAGPRCYTMAHLFGFFNGVWNTRAEAEESLEAMELQNFLGPTWRDAPVRYELFYNQTCKRSDDDVCLQDVAEVFRQRSAELDGLVDRRWEYFWEQVTGQHDQPGSFTQRLLDRLARSDKALASWFDGLTNAVLAKITALSTLLAENPPTAQDTAEHTAQLITAGLRGERAVLVAHSQGNLFVNAAYGAYLAHSRAVGRALGEDTNYVAAQVVHIAPASPTLRGPYVLADVDLVINGLRRVDGTYLAVSNFSLARDAKDASGHKLLDTYLDEARPARSHIRQLITQALDAL